MSIKKLYKFIIRVAWLKSFWFNLHYFPFKTAVKLPVLVFRHTLIGPCDGKIVFVSGDGNKPLIKRGLVRIGAPHVSIID
jgi:hypothetical protein